MEATMTPIVIADLLGIRLEESGRSDLFINVPRHPELSLPHGWLWVQPDHAHLNDGLRRIEMGGVELLECCGEVIGEVNLRQLRGLGRILFGATLGQALLDDYRHYHWNSVLEMLFAAREVKRVDLYGDVLVDEQGHHHTLRLWRGGEGFWVPVYVPLASASDPKHPFWVPMQLRSVV